jgi:hypothetical protein
MDDNAILPFLGDDSLSIVIDASIGDNEREWDKVSDGGLL